MYGPIWIPVHLALAYGVVLTDEGEYENIIPLVVSVFLHAGLFLSTNWFVRAEYRMGMRSASSIAHATHVVTFSHKFESGMRISPVHRLVDGTVYVDTDCKRMYYNAEAGRFDKAVYPCHHPISYYTSHDGWTSAQARSQVSGPMDIPVPSFLGLFKQHVLEPFFVFQMFCVLLWLLDEYWNYALLTLALLVLLEAQMVNRRIRDLRELRNIKPPIVNLQVKRDGKWIASDSSRVVPGDLVMLEVGTSPDGTPIPCDLLLLKGAALVNEAMLTGESVPVLKEPISGGSDTHLDMTGAHRSSVLFAGSSLVAVKHGSRNAVVGFVLKTGFATSQGKLIRTILFASSRVTASSREALRFILVLFAVALVAAGYVLYEGLNGRPCVRSGFKIFLSVSHILTSVIPPEFPITLSITVTLALVHLVRNSVYCTEPFRIPTAGKVTDCCFDKTGTLTSSEMALAGIHHAENQPDLAEAVLGCCHSLSYVSKTSLVGDPIEKAAFGSLVDWQYKDDTDVVTNASGSNFKIEKRYAFDASIQRMSVLVTEGGKRQVMLKGSPESVQECLAVVPEDYVTNYQELTRKGFRVLALAHRVLDKDDDPSETTMARETVETKCVLVGLCAFSYTIKPYTVRTIGTLTAAGFRCSMITGDHVLTAVHVARNVGILPLAADVVTIDAGTTISEVPESNNISPLVVEGDPTLAIQAGLAPRVAVWARASPNHKRDIVAALAAAGRTPLFCGDGTNDVAALKAAPIGVALMATSVSVAERLRRKATRVGPMDEDLSGLTAKPGDASVAAPFAYRGDTIRCIPLLIRSGRASLALVIQMYKILSVNSLITAFALSVMTLKGVKLGDAQTAVEALLMSVLSFMMSRFPPSKNLPNFKPVESVFKPSILVSIFAQAALHVILVWIGQSLVPTPDGPIDIDAKFVPSLANTVAFIQLFSAHVATCVTNFEGPPSLPELRSNRPVVVILTVAIGLIVCMATEVMDDVNASLELVAMGPLGGYPMVTLVAGHLIGGLALGYSIRTIFERRGL